MKKLLVLFMAFFIFLLPMSLSTVSCMYDAKNTASGLIAWFDANYSNRKVKSVQIDYICSGLYKFDGYVIDKVVYDVENVLNSYNLLLDNSQVDYVIYSNEKHNFYDINRLEDNVYAFVSWCYVLNNDLNKSLFILTGNYVVKYANVEPVSDGVYTDYILSIFYIVDGNSQIQTKTFVGKWENNLPIPTFVLTSKID